MKLLLAAILASACVAGLTACSSSNEDAADTSPERQASAGQDCRKSPSTASAILIANRLEQEIRFEAGGVYCAQWSGTGNPGNYSGSVIPAGKTAYWGLEFGNTQRHGFTANFILTGNGRSILRDPPLYVRLDLNDASKNEVSKISTSPASADASFSSDTYIVGDDAAGPIRIVPAAVTNPGDGTWTGSAGRAKTGFLIRLQNVR